MTEKTPEMEATALSEAAAPAGEGEAAIPAPAAKLDLGKFLAGVTPAQRSVRLYGNGSGRVDLDRIEIQLSEAKVRRQQAIVNRLQKERSAAIRALKSEHVMDLQVEGWTARRSDAFSDALTAEGVKDVLSRNLRQAAAQISHVDGVPLSEGGLSDLDLFDLLMELHEIPGMDSQVGRLVRVIAEVNADPEVTVPLS